MSQHRTDGQLPKLFIAALWLCLTFTANAARVDSIAINSTAMRAKVKTTVILPNAAVAAQAVHCPVLYLLHGYGGDEKDWIDVIKPNLPEIADEKGIIFVCPDGKNSWYLDSPLKKNSRYESFISAELIEYIDEHYNTLADRDHRAIAGLSMGGCGALFNAFRHKNVFGAVGSMSGATDILQRKDNKSLIEFLGDFSTNAQNWESLSVLNQLDKIANGDLSIIIDCGNEDHCLVLNETLNKALWKKGIDHDYIIRPGKHNAVYWRNAIDYQILFFCKFFREK
jgi:S-formylglutathione hydrolase FrmB